MEMSGQLQTAADTRWLGDWAGLRVGLDNEEKRKISCTCRELNPGSSASSLSLSQLSYLGEGEDNSWTSPSVCLPKGFVSQIKVKSNQNTVKS
jgi:hypothetical protein